LFVGDTSNWRSTTYVFRYSKLNNYFFALIRNHYRNKLILSEIFWYVYDISIARQQICTLNIILIVKENHIWYLNGYRNVLLLYGTVKEKKRIRRKTATNDGNALNILAALQSNSTICTRQLERECELNSGLILRILLKNKFHPYHNHLHQNLEKFDFVSGNFCNIMLRMINDLTFFSRVLFFNEAKFCNNG